MAALNYGRYSIYPVINSPLPNPRWLHQTALRYVQRVQLGAYRRQKGLNWAQNGLILFVSAPRMVQDHFWEKAILTHFSPIFCSQNGPFSKHFGIFHMPKRVTTGSKWAKKHLFEHPQWSTINFGKTSFQPIFDQFLVPKRPLFKAFGIFHGPKRVTTGSKWGKNTCLSIPNGQRHFWKNTFSTHF